MVKITFYGGASEIGGNKFLLEDKGAKIYLDFGQGFDFGEDYFYDYLQPRSANGMEVYFEFNMIPKLSKLYNKEILHLTDLPYKKSDIDAVFISHSHSDHIGHLNFLDEDIPIYLGHGTHKITELYHNLFSSLVDIGSHNKIIHFKTGDKIKVKHLIIEPIHVEHSIPGAYGFIIHTSKGAIAYTGDFRIHGPRADMTQEFLEKARKAKPIALLCEGTRISREADHNYTEEEVEKESGKIISQSKGIVFTYFSMTNTDRFMSLYKAAVKNKRIMVIGTKLAYIINNLRDKITVLPDVINDPNIKIYFRICKSCTFAEKDYYVWEREYLKNKITYHEIIRNQKKYLMHLGFNGLMELVYLQPKNAHFIYSMSEHFLEGEGNEDEKRVWENWMEHFKIKFHKVHCSGHASKTDLKKTVETIQPKLLIPIHTQEPEKFKEYHSNVKIVKKGDVVKL